MRVRGERGASTVSSGLADSEGFQCLAGLDEHGKMVYCGKYPMQRVGVLVYQMTPAEVLTRAAWSVGRFMVEPARLM